MPATQVVSSPIRRIYGFVGRTSGLTLTTASTTRRRWSQHERSKNLVSAKGGRHRLDAEDVGGVGGLSSRDRRWRVCREARRLNVRIAAADSLPESVGRA